MTAERLCLVELSTEHEAEFRAMNDGLIAAENHFAKAIPDFAAYVQQLQDHALGRSLPEGWVPYTVYYLVRGDGRMLGLSSLRHRLTPSLEDFGGHIGYAVRPSEQRKGYGTRLLALTLEKARAYALNRVLVTCDPANVASARIIEKNGGVLASRTLSPTVNRITSRYLIDLPRRALRGLIDLADAALVCIDIQPRKPGERVWTWQNRHPDYVKSAFTPDELNAAEAHFHGVMLPNALRVAGFARRHRLPRVFVHWASDTVHEALQLSPDDRVIPKTEMDAFISSSIARVLVEFGRRSLLMIGGHTQGCLGRTAASAVRVGYRCIAVRDATYDCSIIRWPKGLAAVPYDLIIDADELLALDAVCTA